MKKILLTIALTILGAMILAVPVLAVTTVSLSPASVNVVSGKSFNVVIAVNPQGVSNYTEKIELTYPADLLEVKSFTLGSNWMAFIATGYDTTIENANNNGVLIKTAGYPNPGLSSAATFGTVSFYAKKAGSGTIKLGNGSLALDANNQNVLAGASVQTAVAISTSPVQTTPTAPMAVPKKKTPIVQEQPIAPVSAPEEETPIVQIEQEAPIVQEQPTAPQPIASQSLLASVGSAVTLGTNSAIVGILVTVIILALIGYATYAVIQRVRRKNLGKLQ